MNLPDWCVFAFGRWCRRRFDRCDRTIVSARARSARTSPRTMLRPPRVRPAPGRRSSTPDPQLDRELPVGLLRRGPGRRRSSGSGWAPWSSRSPTPATRRWSTPPITAHRLGCATLVVPRMFELHQDGPDVERLRSYPLLRLGTAPTSRPSWWIKRLADVAAGRGRRSPLLSPVIALCALAVLVESGRPIIFRQVRVGMDGRTFVIYKLRSVRQSRRGRLAGPVVGGGRRPGRPGRPVPAPHLARRAAAAVEHPARRHVHCRTASGETGFRSRVLRDPRAILGASSGSDRT